jgi:hypothetical protein
MPTTDPRDPSRQDNLDDSAGDRERVGVEIAGRLREREIELTGRETSDELADMLTAVERFEHSVSALGGDSMTNAPDSSQPERADYVVPARKAGEAADAYARRVTSAAEQLRRHAKDD